MFASPSFSAKKEPTKTEEPYIGWSDVLVGLFGVLAVFAWNNKRQGNSHGFGMTRKKESGGLFGA